MICFGVKFINHPNLKRILMPDDWYDHPLKKILSSSRAMKQLLGMGR